MNQRLVYHELRKAFSLPPSMIGVTIGHGCGCVMAPCPALLECLEDFCVKNWRRFGISLAEEENGEVRLACQFRLGRLDEWSLEWVPLQAFEC